MEKNDEQGALKKPPSNPGQALNEGLGVLLNEEETMEYTAKLPTEVGLYRHRWDFRGQMREQVLFVGYTNVRAPRLQGSEPNAYNSGAA